MVYYLLNKGVKQVRNNEHYVGLFVLFLINVLYFLNNLYELVSSALALLSMIKKSLSTVAAY